MLRQLTGVFALLFSLVIVTQAQDTIDLTLVHTSNVVDAHQVGADGIGGTARVAHLVESVRDSNENVLVVDGGDRFLAPPNFDRNAEIMNELGYDAMNLGNHEFNGGNVGVLNFIAELDFPVVAANIDFSNSPLLADTIDPYTIIDVNGVPVGIIGLANEETPTLSSPGPDLIFLEDEAAVTQAAVDELTAQGVNIIVLIAHREANENAVLASTVSGVDVIVGGSDNALLSNTADDADFNYPIETTSRSEQPVLIVQTPEGNRYLGQLNMSFDAEGVLVSWSGDNTLLNADVAIDEDFAALIDELLASDAEEVTDVGTTDVVLLGGDPCREVECTMGNLITDAIRDYAETQIAVFNSGGIRASIGAGTITDQQILQVLPFSNAISTMELRGEDVIAMIEHGVSLGGDASVRGSGRFLQVSGLRYTWSPTRPVGNRVESIEILSADGTYIPIAPDAVYSVATNDFIRGGGDEFGMLAENAIDPFDFGPTVDDVLIDYIEANSPITTETEGRITRTQ